MSKIELEIARTLDGSTPYMAAILIDSYGDKLLKEFKLEDIDQNNPDGFKPIDYFTPCAHCGVPVLDCNYENGSDCCDRCNNGHLSGIVPPPKAEVSYGAFVPLTIHEEPTSHLEVKTMEERIKVARQEAEDEFWAVIVKHFPEATNGAFYMSDMEDIMLSWVNHWVENNVPTTWKDIEGKPEDWTEGMYLRYPGIWHMHQTGGGCMVVTTDNVVVDAEHRYLGVTSECVVVYTDTFEEGSFLNVWKDCNAWTLGDNPCVLMNILDEAFGGSCLWNTGHLFDDIMTIAKSGKC